MPLLPGTLRRYPNPVFIETGSHTGKGIEAALEAGFRLVISIELSNKWFEHCKEKFRGRAQILHGDSGEVLAGMLPSRGSDPITFWLDGHYSGGDTARGTEESPLLREIDAIIKNLRKGDIILIDDMRCFSVEHHGFDRDTLASRLEDAGMTVTYLDGANPEGGVFKHDILLAV